MAIGHRVTDVIQKIGSRFGMHITGVDNTLPQKRRRFLADLDIELVLDVGANVGHYAQELRRTGYGGRIVSFEPIAAVYQTLSATMAGDSAWTGVHAALGDHDGRSTIHVSENLASSSLLKVTEASTGAASATAIQREEAITAARLDTLAAEVLGSAGRVYVKIDVQGFERQVLDGARASLARIVALEVELSLVELYRGQTLMPDMVNLLASLGYQIAWLERGFKDPNTGYLLQMDGVFVRIAGS